MKTHGHSSILSILAAFARIWEARQDSGSHRIQTFVIITTAANALMAQLHSRMMAILRNETERRWLAPEKRIHVYFCC